MWPERGGRRGGFRVSLGLLARGAAGGGIAACLLGCNVALGVSAAVVLGGAGYVAGQCYDQVSVLVRDEAGQQLCDARVTVEREGSGHTLRPCYHASLTSGSWHFTAEQSGLEPATADLTIAERKGPCPHYTHTLELTLRRIGAPKEAPFAKSKAAPLPPSPPPRRVRPALPLGPAFPGANTPRPAPSADPLLPAPPALPPTAPAPSAPVPLPAPVPPAPAPAPPVPAPAP
jgi:hypothetical protein